MTLIPATHGGTRWQLGEPAWLCSRVGSAWVISGLRRAAVVAVPVPVTSV
jgi:hypothetical protein